MKIFYNGGPVLQVFGGKYVVRRGEPTEVPDEVGKDLVRKGRVTEFLDQSKPLDKKGKEG